MAVQTLTKTKTQAKAHESVLADANLSKIYKDYKAGMRSVTSVYIKMIDYAKKS